MELITEFEFELPRGYLDENGELHKKGVMRMATAADEILPLRCLLYTSCPLACVPPWRTRR